MFVKSALLTAVMAWMLAASPTFADEVKIGLDDQKAIGVTIYNNNLALVRDTRSVSVGSGRSKLAFVDVSGQIRPETALLKGAPFDVLEQNFDFDLLSPAKLLEKAVGSTVKLYRENPATGSETVENATILSTNGGVVLQIGNRIEVMQGADGIPGRLVFDTVPKNLRARPTLTMDVQASSSTREDVVLNYLTGGLGWKADYVANLNADETALSLQGWITLTNTSGTTYRDARLQLVAGDVNQVQDQMTRAHFDRMVSTPAMESDVKQESFFEYHLYSLPRPTTIANNQTKQVAFMEAPEVKVTKVLESAGGSHFWYGQYGEMPRQNANVFLELENRESDGLGQPLPGGIVRVYKEDSRNLAQFVGEDRIDHTPKNEEVRLTLGEAFDVTVHRTQTDYRKIGGNAYQTSWKVEVKNAKDEPVSVRIVENPRGDWSITRESLEHVKEAAFKAVWTVDVPAEGETSFTYTVVTR